MPATIDDSTERFLQAATDDLQRQLSIAGSVDGLSLSEGPPGVSLVARIRVAQGVTEVTGFGESMVAAYADLRLRVAEPTLALAFRQVIER
jgi:hypothetical protein